MPELPEVETIARSLRPKLVGRTILEADLRWARTLAYPSARKFRQQIKGQVIKGVGRRAKYINIQLQDYNLMIHLRMSGDLLVKGSKIKPEKHDRLIITLTPSPFAKHPCGAPTDSGELKARISRSCFSGLILLSFTSKSPLIRRCIIKL